MGNIIVRHGQNGNLCHGTVDALHNSRTLINSRQFAVQITGIALSGGNLSLGGGNLTHSLRKGSHIRQNNQDVHIALKGKILCRRQRYSWRNQTFYHGIICQIQKHGHMLGHAALLKSTAEKLSHIMLNAHSRKHNRKLFVGLLS